MPKPSRLLDNTRTAPAQQKARSLLGKHTAMQGTSLARRIPDGADKGHKVPARREHRISTMRQASVPLTPHTVH